MGTKRAEKLQADLALNEKKEFKLGRRTYKIHRLGNWVSLKMSKLILDAESSHGVEGSRKEMINAIIKNRTLAPKCISIMILKTPIKVTLFYWIVWRILHIFYSQEDYNSVLDKILNDQDTMFFFHNMASLQSSNILEREMTEMNTKSIVAKRGSEV